MKLNLPLFLVILVLSLQFSSLMKHNRVHSSSYSYSSSSSSQASATASASAGGPNVSASTSTETKFSSSPSPSNTSSSSSSSSSSENVNGKTSYKINTSVKTNDYPEIQTNIQSNDINKQPKKEIKIGGVVIEKNGHFNNDSERKEYKLSVFFLKALLRRIGYDIKSVTKCFRYMKLLVVRSATDFVHKIGKDKSGYEGLSQLSNLCHQVNDVALRLNNKETFDKVKAFLDRNM